MTRKTIEKLTTVIPVGRSDDATLVAVDLSGRSAGAQQEFIRNMRTRLAVSICIWYEFYLSVCPKSQ
jgi:hypothetical protein